VQKARIKTTTSPQICCHTTLQKVRCADVQLHIHSSENNLLNAMSFCCLFIYFLAHITAIFRLLR